MERAHHAGRRQPTGTENGIYWSRGAADWNWCCRAAGDKICGTRWITGRRVHHFMDWKTWRTKTGRCCLCHPIYSLLTSRPESWPWEYLWRTSVFWHWWMCMPPTMTYTSVARESYYHELTQVVQRAPREDKLIILGDFNARLGTDSETYCNIIGKLERGEKTQMGICFWTSVHN